MFVDTDAQSEYNSDNRQAKRQNKNNNNDFYHHQNIILNLNAKHSSSHSFILSFKQIQ